MATNNYSRPTNIQTYWWVYSLSLNADNPLTSQYEKLTARRDILTTKLSNLQLKIWNNWQQTIEKRIAKGLDSKVMMLLTVQPQQQQKLQQTECVNCFRGIEQTHVGNIDMDVECGCNSGSSSSRNKKVKHTWLANKQTHFHSSTTNAAAAYCHHFNKALTDKTDSIAGVRRVSNNSSMMGRVTNKEFIRAGDENERDNGLNKSSFVSDMKILEINLSLELFTLLRETKYLLALQDIQTRQKQGETTATQLTVVKTHQQQQQLLRQQNQEQHLQQLNTHQLPLTLLSLYAQRDIFWQRKIKLMKIAEYYNSIREGLNASNEMQLIQPVVDVIDERVECASETLTWRVYGKF